MWQAADCRLYKRPAHLRTGRTAMAVPFLDLQAQYRPLRDEIQRALQEVLDTSTYILGPAVARFERAFAEACGTRHAIGVNTGTSALQLALLAAGVRPGDEVIVPAMTFIATAAAVEAVGARPIPVDVDARTATLDPAAAEAALTPRTRALVPVHLYGQAAEMEPLLGLAQRHGLVVVEDAAQAHLATWRGRPCGSLGALAAFSFYPGKNLGAYGEGGAVVTQDDAAAREVRIRRDWGAEKRYHHEVRGFNFRMDGLQGAVLDVKLRHLAAWTEGRRRAAAGYQARLAGLEGLRLPAEHPDNRHVWHVFALRVRRRDAVLRELTARGIGCGIHYPVPLHLQPCYAEWGGRRGQCPRAEAWADEELSLPLFPEITDAQLDEVADALRAALAATA
jgi:dTDP-4-amino-4,6-dideoxygalactose transaminase